MRAWFVVIVLAVVLSGFTFQFVRTHYQPVQVIGTSMEPTLEQGEWLVVESTRPDTEFFRSDFVVLRHNNELAIKRLIGLPGETLEFSQKKIKLFTDQKPEGELFNEPDYDTSTWSFFPATVDLGQDQYYVLGDRRAQSLDSREYGPIKREDLVGRAVAVYWPWRHIRWLH